MVSDDHEGCDRCRACLESSSVLVDDDVTVLVLFFFKQKTAYEI